MYRKINVKIFILGFSLFLGIINLNATDKYAGEIFRIGAGVKNYALGNLGLTNTESPAIVYWNSALLSQNKGKSFELMHAEEFSGLLTFDILSAKISNKIGFVFTRIAINDIPLTKKTDPNLDLSSNNRPKKYKSITNADYILYVGFVRNIGKYHLGITPKLAYRSLAEESGYGFGADLSTYFQPTNNWMLGFKLRDFFSTQILWANGKHEIVNPGMDFESKYQFKFPILKKISNLYFGTEIYAEGRDYASTVSLGDLSFDFHTGLEIKLSESIAILSGFDVEHFTAGLSLQIKKITINYAFEQNSELDNSHRISLGLMLENTPSSKKNSYNK